MPGEGELLNPQFNIEINQNKYDFWLYRTCILFAKLFTVSMKSNIF